MQDKVEAIRAKVAVRVLITRPTIIAVAIAVVLAGVGAKGRIGRRRSRGRSRKRGRQGAHKHGACVLEPGGHLIDRAAFEVPPSYRR